MNNENHIPPTRARAFICDPVCAQPFGHNVLGLKYFSDAARPLFREVLPLASRLLPQRILEEYGFTGAFDFYYHRQIELGFQHRRPSARRDVTGKLIDAEQQSAEKDFKALFDRYRPNGHDAIIFPSVDYYGAIGAFSALTSIDPRQAPSFYIRFIGVMENASSNGQTGLRPMLRQLVELIKTGYSIKLCAETPRYADYLAQEIGSVVDVVPYPPHGEIALATPQDACENDGADGGGSASQSRPYIVSCPGSSRVDKGYLSLLEIFRRTRALDPDMRIRFVTQGLPVHDALHYSNYTNQLYAIPGVQIMPSALTEEQINTGYRQTDLVILPYDNAIYRYRGSAVFMECLARGIPVIALAGSAFCEQITYFGAGVVVDSIEEIVNEVVRHSMHSQQRTRIQLAQARHRYNIDASHAFANWINP